MSSHSGRYIGNDWDDDWDDPDPEDATDTAGDGADGADTPAAAEDEWSLQTVGRAATPTGSIEVQTTLNGLPTAIRIERTEMDGSAARLAKTILLLCRQAGVRAGARQRAELLAGGHTLEAVSYTGLPGEREVAAIDRAVDDFFDEDETGTWLRRV
ncbi:hypothetical protein ASG12_06065 [Williamsia sp. Leaf354]|uniref:hypothetical protein n=1 Tax=Williamsia sp. Leaf354 TaxID=1736349 RepID=UPI0006F88845|nr:hypothetical protein [Williamsia sp. Leaf354]KQS00461.1 hypothetical protein ASG12_06065 [Williamsia sp. Leaf354]